MDLNHETGGSVEGWDSVLQSLQTILSTRVNTRVFRREFGSDVPLLIDAPMNDQSIVALYVAVAEAIERWEPRFELSDVKLHGAGDGVFTMTLIGSYRPKAHLGDVSTVSDQKRTVRMQQNRVDNWSIVA